MTDPKKKQCYCDGMIDHEGEPCPHAPVTFYPAMPDLGLIQRQIERGYVHLTIHEGKTQMRIEAGLASKRSKKMWLVVFHLSVPGEAPSSLSKRMPKARVEDEVLSLAIDYHQRHRPEGSAKPS